MIGAIIRIIQGTSVAITTFDPRELAFSLAMLCVLGVASARRVQDKYDQDVAFAIFVVGVAFFISMFAFVIIEEARLSDVEEGAMRAVIAHLSSGVKLLPGEISAITDSAGRQSCERTLRTIFWVLLVGGLCTIVTTFAMRDRFGLGEE